MADLAEMERGIIESVAEANEGLVMAMSGLCLTLVAQKLITAEMLILHLRAVSETLMRDRKSALTQEAVDQIVFAVQQLSSEGSRTDAGH